MSNNTLEEHRTHYRKTIRDGLSKEVIDYLSSKDNKKYVAEIEVNCEEKYGPKASTVTVSEEKLYGIFLGLFNKTICEIDLYQHTRNISQQADQKLKYNCNFSTHTSDKEKISESKLEDIISKINLPALVAKAESYNSRE